MSKKKRADGSDRTRTRSGSAYDDYGSVSRQGAQRHAAGWRAADQTEANNDIKRQLVVCEVRLYENTKRRGLALTHPALVEDYVSASMRCA